VGEVPLVAVYALRLLLGGLSRIESEYLRPHLVANEFTRERELTEATYYSRVCGPQDVSTVSARDLYVGYPGISSNSSSNAISRVAEDAYRTFVRHGAAVFPSVLSRDTAAKLRDFIVAKNLAQTPGESEFLHSPKHRCVVPTPFAGRHVVCRCWSSNPDVFD
jgi:hypothetical protein